MSTEQEFLKTERIFDSFLKVTLNRPSKLNAFNPELYHAVAETFTKVQNDASLKGILLTGTGTYYSAGNDISVFASQVSKSDKSQIGDFLKQARDMCRDFVKAFITFRKLLVVAVNGPCIGIACTTLPLCDIVYASETAWFQTPFMTLGLSPEGCSSETFPKLMGRSNANEVLVLGKKLDAKRAHELRLVSEVFSQKEFEQQVLQRVKVLAGYPPNALLKAKDLVTHEARVQRLCETNERECDVLLTRWFSKEAQNAMVQFMMRGQQKKKQAKM